MCAASPKAAAHIIIYTFPMEDFSIQPKSVIRLQPNCVQLSRIFLLSFP